ncbi:flippase [Pseudomonas sp. SA3-5]|uniref:Flippase n=1 Tax=Pseudomonas aestuarii TaxID=3018340 RepID=A0ABT4XJV7_9PSED|nr:flippase [Pseudomonas aestuarii]MDA7088509.1 flippase [Pseudomonas aestuarii]
MMGKKQAVKAVSLLWLGSILGAGCAFFTQVLLARALGPATLGAFAAALGVVILVAPLASFGVGGFWLKVFGQEGWQAVRWLRGSLKYALVTTCLVLAALLAWAAFGPHDVTTRGLLIVLSSYLLGQVAVELVSAKLQLEERYLALAIWQFLPHLLRLLLVVMLFLAMVKLLTLWNIAYAYTVISIGVFILGAFFMWRMYCGQLALKGHGEKNVQAEQPVAIASIREVIVQSWPFGLAGVFHLIYFQSDIILLKYIAGNAAAGIYNVAFVIMAAVYMLPSVIYQKFLLPKIHRWAIHDRQRFYKVYRAGNWVMLVSGLLSMLAIWLLAPWGVHLLFGEQYMSAVLPLSILALAAPVRFVATSVGSTLVTQNNMHRKVYYMGVTAMINLGLNFFLIPTYGVMGAAVATVVSEVVLLLIYFWGARAVFSNDTGAAV